ncbi:MAG: hypothetical protein R3B57_13775 [Phycisphaerales bacterium]
MKFRLIDRVIERGGDRLVTELHVRGDEDYLRDHFPTFPVLPGVLMLEAMVQAARELADPGDRSDPPLVLGAVRALKYGRFVKPGESIRVEVARATEGLDFKGRVEVGEGEGSVAASGRFTLRPARLERAGATRVGAPRAFA